MSKLRKRMYAIILPFVLVALVAFIILDVIIITQNKPASWNGWIIYGSIIGGCLIVALIAYIIMKPIISKLETKEYSDSISQDFSDMDDSSLKKLYPILGFDEVVKVQIDGLYFSKLRTLVKYQDLKLSITHKEFYGSKSNYVRIQIDQKKYKNFPNSIFVEYSKDIMYQFSKYQVEVENIEALSAKPIKEKKETLKKYKEKINVFGIVISICFVVAFILLIVTNNMGYAYIAFIALIFTLSSAPKPGVLLLTKDSVILKRSFVKVEIMYDEIINININQKNMVISSPFNFIEFKADELIANEILKQTIKK